MPGSTLAIFGAGGVGLSALIAAVHLTGATVAVVDLNPARLALATRLGAAHSERLQPHARRRMVAALDQEA